MESSEQRSLQYLKEVEHHCSLTTFSERRKKLRNETKVVYVIKKIILLLP